MTQVGCEKFSAERFFRDQCEGGVPTALSRLFTFLQTPQGQDIFCIANGIGALEPLSYTRPGAGEIKQVYDKMITVPPATLGAPNQNGFNPDGIKPSDGLLIHICAPENKILVVDKLRGKGEDLTALTSGVLLMKRLAVVGFSEGLCKAGEPGAGDELGTFENIEHLLLPGRSGFDLYAQNWNPYSPATFSVHAEMWETC